MFDDDSVDLDSDATEEEEEEEERGQDASMVSTSASTPETFLQKATPAVPDAGKLQELLQLRARQAIEGAKARHVVRENQRMADGYVLRLLQRAVQKLGWVEEEKLNREKSRKKQTSSWAAAGPAGPSAATRRRDRKRESRRCKEAREYEEVPGGGQFLMMLLNKNKQSQQLSGAKSEKDEEALRGDPAIVQMSRGGEHVGGSETCIEAPPGLSSPPGLGKGAGVKGIGASGKAADRRYQAGGTTQEPPKPKEVSRKARNHGGPGAEKLNLQSLLRGAGIDSPREESSPLSERRRKEAPGLSSHTSTASDRIMAKVEPAIAIPPMLGFSNIWGSPSSGPSTSPTVSTWCGPAGDPWLSLPDSYPTAPPGLSRHQSAPGPQEPVPASGSAYPAGPSRKGRSGRHRERDRRREEVQDEDLWDMPHATICNSRKGVQERLSDMELPEFFRDSAAPTFVDHVLGDSDSFQLEARCNDKRGSTGDNTIGELSIDDCAYNACLGSLRLEDSDDDIVSRKPVWQ